MITFLQWSVLIYIILVITEVKKKKIKLLFIPSTNHMNMETLKCAYCAVLKKKKITSIGYDRFLNNIVLDVGNSKLIHHW